MAYFSRSDHNAIISLSIQDAQGSSDHQRVFQRMLALHRSLQPQIKHQRLPFATNLETQDIVTQHTNTSPITVDVLTILYTRTHDDAEIVEGMMGRDGLSTSEGVRSRHHPTLELRLTPADFAIELVVPPSAWYDQQNFVGKMTIDQHREAFCHLLSKLDGPYRMGFWGGTHLQEMHLKTDHLPPEHVLLEFVDTFAAGRDWLRIGRWYEPESDLLEEDGCVQEIFQRIVDLTPLYDFMAWKTTNNFQSFYKKAWSRS